MDPKENDTQNPPIDDRLQQPTPQQRADGELIVSHEVEADLTSANDVSASDPTLPPIDPTVTGSAMDPMGGNIRLDNGTPSESFMPPEAPAAPTALGQPVMPADAMPPQPPQPMPQPDPSQQFPQTTAPVGPGVPPVVPTDPAVAPMSSAAPVAPSASPKKRAMVLVTMAMLGVILLGLAVYALMQL